MRASVRREGAPAENFRRLRARPRQSAVKLLHAGHVEERSCNLFSALLCFKGAMVNMRKNLP
jgi:hypothetical protein